MRGFDGEKSEIQDIGTELKAFTTFAPGARSATISLEVRPEMSPNVNGLYPATRVGRIDQQSTLPIRNRE